MTSIILMPEPGSLVDRADCDSLLASLSVGRDVRASYVLGYDPPANLTAILRSGDGLLIYNVAEQRLMTVAPGVVLDWLREAGI
jgi:hypothetical protein